MFIVNNDHTSIAYITIDDLPESFTDILDNFPLLLSEELEGFDVSLEIKSIFPTSFSIYIEGEPHNVLDSIAALFRFLISSNIFSFNFLLHTLE